MPARGAGIPAGAGRPRSSCPNPLRRPAGPGRESVLNYWSGSVIHGCFPLARQSIPAAASGPIRRSHGGMTVAKRGSKMNFDARRGICKEQPLQVPGLIPFAQERPFFSAGVQRGPSCRYNEPIRIAFPRRQRQWPPTWKPQSNRRPKKTTPS
jgi:hypothetical protein